MRQRKVKNLEEKMLSCNRFFTDFPSGYKGDWRGFFGNQNDLYLELGAGKGAFLIKQAAVHPDRNYIGVEGRPSVVYRALQKLEAADACNVRFVRQFVNDPGELFAGCELSGIYLNFSDPWPKKRHAFRRLTFRDYLRKYHTALKPGGFVEVKTDDDSLFEFTVGEIEACRIFEITEKTDDLHSSEFKAADITSEYEDKFIAEGRKIHYIKLTACK